MEETYAPRQMIYLHLNTPELNTTKQTKIKTKSIAQPQRFLSNVCLKKTSQMIRFNTGFSASLELFFAASYVSEKCAQQPAYNATWVTLLYRCAIINAGHVMSRRGTIKAIKRNQPISLIAYSKIKKEFDSFYTKLSIHCSFLCAKKLPPILFPGTREYVRLI